MNKLPIIITSVLLAFIISLSLPVQAFASSTGTSGKYISEVKVGYAKKSDDAKAALDGYTILKDNKGNDVDLNKDAGGDRHTEGDMCVYLGYKTTDDVKDGITDLAVMNMKGAYRVEDYKTLMDNQLNSQIIPFVESFKSAIDEYRVNYNSDNSLNKAKAAYIHDCLNKLVDDDTGKNLGDLLLSQTKYEMGDDAYNALSDTEKKEHADIVTMIAQSNGRAALLMKNLVTRGADTSENTWVDRMQDLTYDDMIADTGLAPTKAKQQLDKQYFDYAEDILGMWNAFSDYLATYDSCKDTADSFDKDAYDKALADMQSVDENTSSEDLERITQAYNDAIDKYNEFLSCVKVVCVHDYLEGISYDDGTLLDFFSEDKDDPTAIYPLVASLSEGQRAGLDFVSISDLVTVAMTDEEGYSSADISNAEETSIYEDVDRGIYEPGGVALTSDAIRNDTSDVNLQYKTGGISGLTIAAWVITGVTLIGAVTSAAVAKHYANIIEANPHTIKGAVDGLRIADETGAVHDAFYYDMVKAARPAELQPMFTKLAIGCSVAMVLMAGISVYLTWRDLNQKYDVEFSPIPKYIVDEKDITAFNKKGEKIVINNQSAYYKTVETNRSKGDDWYDVLGTSNDLKGGVGKQWLSLYSVKNEAEDPILVSSLLSVVSDDNVPSGYETGIHMFGTDAACNLNSGLYVFNDSAPSMYVYFQRDEGAKVNNESGSIFAAGFNPLVAFAGIAVGVLGTVVVTMILKKRKKTQE